jgi:hypothetical protein
MHGVDSGGCELLDSERVRRGVENRVVYAIIEIPQIMMLLLASFVVVFPRADLSAATRNPFLARHE